MGEWQPIETAPRNWTPVLVFGPIKVRADRAGSGSRESDPGIRVARFSHDMLWGSGWFVLDGFYTGNTVEATHWMPLPAPPETG